MIDAITKIRILPIILLFGYGSGSSAVAPVNEGLGMLRHI